MGWFSDNSLDRSMRCFREHLQNTCGGCEHLDSKNSELVGFFNSHYEYMCTLKGYTRWDDRKCYDYDEVSPTKVDCAKRYYTFTGRKYFYILTAICNVLGIKQEDGLFQNFKTLIQIVRNDIDTFDKAIQYDVYGPIIADKIESDFNRVELCKDLLTNYLAKAFIAIEENRLEDAILIYEEMVKFLYVRYSQKDDFKSLIDVDVITNQKVLVK